MDRTNVYNRSKWDTTVAVEPVILIGNTQYSGRNPVASPHATSLVAIRKKLQSKWHTHDPTKVYLPCHIFRSSILTNMRVYCKAMSLHEVQWGRRYEDACQSPRTCFLFYYFARWGWATFAELFLASVAVSPESGFYDYGTIFSWSCPRDPKLCISWVSFDLAGWHLFELVSIQKNIFNFEVVDGRKPSGEFSHGTASCWFSRKTHEIPPCGQATYRIDARRKHILFL